MLTLCFDCPVARGSLLHGHFSKACGKDKITGVRSDLYMWRHLGCTWQQAGCLELHLHITGYFRVFPHSHKRSDDTGLDDSWAACHSPLQQGRKMHKLKPHFRSGVCAELTSSWLMQLSCREQVRAAVSRLKLPGCPSNCVNQSPRYHLTMHLVS